MLAQKIQELKHKLIEYALLVENMIAKSIKGLESRDKYLFMEIMQEEEPKANEYDNILDEMCTTTIAQFEPLASDLRTVLMILKMNKDLERMADHVVNISESGIILINRPFVKPFQDIFFMAEVAAGMLKDSIAAFVNSDVALAGQVCERDEKVDEIGDKILKDLTKFMTQEKTDITRSLHVLRIAHNLERIADISTNICEEVIYIVEGKDIKHHKDEEAPQP